VAIKLYWCRGKGRSDPAQRNFGDYLSPLLVEMLSHQAVEYAPVHQADLLAIGSIMHRERKARRFLIPRRLHVWGAGTPAPGLSFSGRHYYHAVRGQKTIDQIRQLKTAPALGDPGLLAGLWWEGRPRPAKRYRIGLIPHYVDQPLASVKRCLSLPGVKPIDVFWPVEEVLKSVQECDFIVSSSMHGLIVADAFAVPNRRIIFSRGTISDYKFVDYYSAFGLDEPPALPENGLLEAGGPDLSRLIGEYARPGLAELQDRLVKAFPSL